VSRWSRAIGVGGALVVGALAVGGSGCAKRRDQWMVYVYTPVQIPQFGDRLLIEVIDDQSRPACADCTRELAVDRGSFPVTFGVDPSSFFDNGTRPRVRARLYRRKLLGPDGRPRSAALIDQTGRLPSFTEVPFKVPMELPEYSTHRAAIVLVSGCFGRPPDLEGHRSCSLKSVADGTAADPSSLVRAEPDLAGMIFTSDEDEAYFLPGNDNLHYHQPCTEPIPDEMVCNSSEDFLMGNEVGVGFESDFPFRPEIVRSVVPFGIDRDEMTVGKVRDLVRARKIAPEAGALLRRGADAATSQCTWLGPDDPTNDALPINCVSQELATTICAALGKRLPSETEWELSARDGATDSTWPWGEDAPTCDRAILGRGRDPGAGAGATESRACRSLGPAGPVAGGSPRDVTPRGIKNLGGNVAEWVADRYQDYDESCWTIPFELVGATYPCDTGTKSLRLARWSVRGGSWARGLSSAAGFTRFGRGFDDPSAEVGFRCAKDGIPESSR